jgi:uncharacterized protein YjeT (DUF2065 family)
MQRPKPKRLSRLRDFAAAIGLVFAIEGMLLAGFTEVMRVRMAQAAKETPARLRLYGIGAAVVGVAIVWAARRFM